MTVRMGRRSSRIVGAVAAAAVAGTAFTAPAATAAGRDRGPGRGHEAVQAAMEAQVEAGVPGVLGQAVDARGTWNGSAGVADLRTERPRKSQDRFRVGSITKTFVATVLLQLEAEHKLDLDDTVDKWLPGVVSGNGHDGREITVRQLLNHTSGVYDYTSDPDFAERVFGPGFPEHRYETWTDGQLVAVAMKHEPTFAPGTGWSYSNTNYILAGMVIEKATGNGYGDEVERRILRPLGLRATTLPGTDARMPRPHGRAYSTLGTVPPDAEVHDVTDLNPSIAGAAGEVVSTTGDLNRFYRALLRGKLLPENKLRAMLTAVPTGVPGMEGYGLGISPQKLSCGTTVWGHGGGIHGSLSMAGTTRDGRHAAAFNFNADWAGDGQALLEAEFCGKTGKTAGKTAGETAGETTGRALPSGPNVLPWQAGADRG